MLIDSCSFLSGPSGNFKGSHDLNTFSIKFSGKWLSFEEKESLKTFKDMKERKKMKLIKIH